MEQLNAVEMGNIMKEILELHSQAPKLKTFESTRKYYALVGITSILAKRAHPFNGSILCDFLVLGSCIFCTFVFVIFDAETFAEYTQAIYTSSIAMQIMFTLLITISKVDKLFGLIHGCDNLINTSEFEMSQPISHYISST